MRGNYMPLISKKLDWKNLAIVLFVSTIIFCIIFWIAILVRSDTPAAEKSYPFHSSASVAPLPPQPPKSSGSSAFSDGTTITIKGPNGTFERFTLVHDNMNIIKMYIDNKTRQGFDIKFIVPQSVTTSEAVIQGRPIHGNILLVMEKIKLD